MVEPVCVAEGYELVSVECLSDRGGPVVRICIDKNGGVSIDDCVHVNRCIGDLMDVELVALAAYRLEVSSPGPNRLLSRERDFQRFAGHRIKVELTAPLEGRKRFTGVLQGISGSGVTLVVDNKTIHIGFEQIGKARLAGSHGEQ